MELYYNPRAKNNELTYKKLYFKGDIFYKCQTHKIEKILNHEYITWRDSGILKDNLYHPLNEEKIKKILDSVLLDKLDGIYEVDWRTVRCEIYKDDYVCNTHTPQWFYENCTPLEYIKIMKDAEKYVEEE